MKTTQPPSDAAAVAAAYKEYCEIRRRINDFNAIPLEVRRAIARNSICWPVMAGKGQVPVRDQAELLDEIQLSEGLPIIEHIPPGYGKAPSLKTGVNDVARVHLLMAIDERERGFTGTEHLPPLTREKKSLAAWSRYCWAELLRAIPEPENDELLKSYGVTKAEKYVKDGMYSKRREKAEIRGRQEAIKDAFFKAIARLVK